MRLVFLVQNISGVLIVGQDELCASLSSCPSIIKRACRRRAAQVFAASPQKLSPPIAPRGGNGRALSRMKRLKAVSFLKAAPRTYV